jgi:septum site-determining protein MinD
MIGQVLTITSGKGGVGKTSTTANLGVALAEKGQRVVCLDADIGLRNLDLAMGLENQVRHDLIDWVEGRCRLGQVFVQDKDLPSLHLIPAAQNTDKSSLSPSDMNRICSELRADRDWILIDSPAGIERGFRNALAPADRVILVTNPGVAALREADRVIGLVEEAGKPLPWLIINRLDPTRVRLGEMMGVDDILKLLAIELIGMIPEDDRVRIALDRGKPVARERTSSAGQAYRETARRLLGEEVPFREIGEEAGALARLKRIFRLDR